MSIDRVEAGEIPRARAGGRPHRAHKGGPITRRFGEPGSGLAVPMAVMITRVAIAMIMRVAMRFFERARAWDPGVPALPCEPAMRVVLGA